MFLMINGLFLVSIESTGALTAEELVKQAIQILMNKSDVLLNEINSKKN